jgi:INO80 complex subunit B
MAQKKADSAKQLASNGVRWVMGPSGTVVTFSENIGLPSIFNNPCRYPPPREKCAGPLCNNKYKYRDSRTNLPLCSLQCYLAIHDV